MVNMSTPFPLKRLTRQHPLSVPWVRAKPARTARTAKVHRYERRDYTPAPESSGAVLPVISASARLARLRPRGLDPVCRSGRLVMAIARLRPIRRCGDVADRDCDDP